MSRAAEDWVDTFTHPRVTDAAHEVLKAIAGSIPEGETTTPRMGMGMIARSAHVDRRTVWTWLPVLVEIGVVRVVDGGHGRKARYTLVHVAGAAPITAVPLPLRADLRPVTRPRPASDTPDLFSDPPIGRSEREELVIRSEGSQVHKGITWITRITSWAAATITRITSWPSVRRASEQLVIGTCDPTCDPALVLNTARDVLPLKESTTTTTTPDAPRPRAVESPPCGSPPCRYFATTHAYCPGRVHVPMPFHLEERRKLARQPGETDTDLDKQLFARYTEILAAIPETEPILDRNEFEFWKRVLRAAPSGTIPKARAPTGDGRDVYAEQVPPRRRWRRG